MEQSRNRGDDSTSEEKVSPGRMFLPSLTMASFALGPIAVVASLLLYDMAETFSVNVAVMGQISTLSSVVAVVFAVLMGVLSVRFKHKSLLLVGLLFMTVSTSGCFLAFDYNWMLISYGLSGVAVAMASPMASALIGEHFPLERRARAVGWIVAGGSLAYLIGGPTIAFIAGFGGWRAPLLAFVLPISAASVLLAFVGVPSASRSGNPSISKEAYLESFKAILKNRSALACLTGDVLRMVAFTTILLYGTTFFRVRFELPVEYASFVILGGALFYTLGGLTSGRLINRFGRKPSTVLTTFLSGAFTVSYAFMPNLWLSLGLNFVASWFFGMVAAAANCLTLEQLPKFRGTMMSVDSAAVNLGSAVGGAIGGLALLWFDYEGVGSVLGAMGILAALVFYFFATDPTRT